MRILYITYDGLTDQLGQSQVLPYLKGLANLGNDITIISCEKKENDQNRKMILSEIENLPIRWFPLTYSKNPPVISTLFDILKIKNKATELQSKYYFQLVHCRSYIPALIGLFLKKKFQIPLLFDMRGFWADERLEGGLWNLKNPLYKFIYKYFKKKEKQLLAESDHIISLTEKAKEFLILNYQVPLNKISVIPCCADLNLFKNPLDIELEKVSIKLSIPPGTFVLSYLGATGTWYMLNEMLDFFKTLLSSKPDAVFLFISNENPANIISLANKKGITEKNLRIIKALRTEVPSLLKLSSYSIFFIKPVFSKIASSPTKLAEIMSLGIPVITNRGIGDVDEIIKKSGAGFLLEDFNQQEYEKIIQQMDKSFEAKNIVQYAKDHFSLEKGVEEYLRVYKI